MKFGIPGARRWLVAVALGAAALAGCTALDTQQRQWIFQPAKETWWAGAQAAVGMEPVWIEFASRESGTAARLHGLWLANEDPQAPVLLYLHGARWDVTGSAPRIRRMGSLGFSVLAIDYRGFGKSDGEMPSEEGVYDDAAVAWRWLVAREPDASKRYVYGHSLGTAVATELAVGGAARDGVAGLILEGGFTSLPEMAKALAPSWLPIDWLVTQRFDTIDRIARVPAPVLLVHGTGDRLVPHRFSEALYAAARDPKKLVLVEGGGHYNTSWVGAPQYREAIAEMFGVPARGSAAALAPAAGKPAPRSRVAAAAVPALLPAAAAR